MNKLKQRIKIAEVCGYRMEKTKDGMFLYDPNGNYKGQLGYSFESLEDFLPEYLEDLNDMHEAEMKLTVDQCWKYNAELQKLNGTYAGMGSGYVDEWPWHSSASKRAEAFLKTLNLWEE